VVSLGEGGEEVKTGISEPLLSEITDIAKLTKMADDCLGRGRKQRIKKRIAQLKNEPIPEHSKNHKSKKRESKDRV
jgi:hypothetical protein